MKPSIGRTVHLYEASKPAPMPAVITSVHSETCVNVVVIEEGACWLRTVTSVCLDDTAASSWWSWPPKVG